ncbi:hypothetical protein DP092_26460, partial [Pseudomonas sp. MDMC224]
SDISVHLSMSDYTECRLDKLDATGFTDLPLIICSYCEHAVRECKHGRLNASRVAANPSTLAPSVAVISSRKSRRLQVRAVSNASRYI